MKYRYLGRSSNGELILFFTGWGMSPETVKHLTTESTIVVFYDYNDMSTDFPFEAALKMYDKVHLIAWSFGVWTAYRTMMRYRDQIFTSIAINGTIDPISRDYGISPEVFSLTLSSFSEQTRETFFRRMCRDKETYERFCQNPPQRSTESQRSELIAIQKDIEIHEAADSLLFTSAIAGSKDVIIPFRSQKNCWEYRVKLQEKPFPHFPFFSWESWDAIIEDATR